MDNIDNIIRFENGEMNEEEVIDFFQDGITTGRVWKLQSSYGRMAKSLIESGHCFDPNSPDFEE